MQFGHTGKIVGAVSCLELQPGALEFFLDMRRPLHGGLLRLPDFIEIGEFLLQPFKLRLEIVESFT